MTKDFEKSSGTSGIASAGVASGRPVSAHVVRELARQANYQATRSGLVYRWTPETSASLVAPCRWQFLAPQCSVPVRVSSGTTSLRCGFRAAVPSGRTISFGVVCTPAGQDVIEPDDTNTITMFGTGTSQRVDGVVPCPASRDFLLTLFWRHAVNLASDPVITTASYDTGVLGTFESGAWATPTVGAVNTDFGVARIYDTLNLSGIGLWLNDPTNANAVQRLGYYLFAYDTGSTTTGQGYSIRQHGTFNYVGYLDCAGATGALVSKRYTVRQGAVATLGGAAIYEVHGG